MGCEKKLASDLKKKVRGKGKERKEGNRETNMMCLLSGELKNNSNLPNYPTEKNE